ncbi:GRB2-associated-binding protein 3 [Meriones unguiculatus]|uniref:GRB2-associated-binding protein 3 n=1 Tax=Meriones unguiculatus TaxID=10047 RepID=UPI00293EBA1C|nr:GRB2-associated-binding protein 3 [Meriones unguiculatus]
MSTGDAVCTGWLVKSPPERKLQRYAWRKRWFVLRRGRMSGNPDVLEYYRNKHSSKPIRVIDLSECTVWKHAGPGFVRKEFQNNFVFIVKTASRTFYLVAKTEEEMQVWVHSISQVCNFSHLEDGAADSVESFSHMPSSLQPSPASSLHTAHVANSALPKDDPNANTVATEETRSESEFPFLPDYLILSNCETGRLHHGSLPTRCESWSNSDRSLEQTSFDDVFLDGLQPFTSNNLVHPLYYGNGSQDVPSTRPQPALIWNREINGPSRNHVPSSSLLESSLNPAIHVGKKQVCLPSGAKELNIMSNTPPPRPPKPSYLSERLQDQLLLTGHSSNKKPGYTMMPRRTSLSGLDHVGSWKGDVQSQSLRHRDKRLSLNLPCKFSPMYPTASPSAEDGYVPMSPKGTTSGLIPHDSQDDYIPMSSIMLSELPADLEPPPVNRDLKPQRKSRPPPLDLRNLSTIREHTSLTRTHTVPCNRTSFLSPQRNGINSARFFATPSKEEESYIQMEEYRAVNSLSSSALTWTKKFSLDYLALDFNSASPAPVQQKPFLSEEQRVDYVQVDEQKTQALQSTKQEWTDERQSKA